jgi:hypothetical protein
MLGPVLAPCGIDCLSCDLRNLPSDAGAAHRIVAWFRDQGWTSPGEGAPQFIERSMCCKGCPGDRAMHWSPGCAILKCCIDERMLTHCSGCKDFPCGRPQEWAERGPKYEAALMRLTELRAQETAQAGPQGPATAPGPSAGANS